MKLREALRRLARPSAGRALALTALATGAIAFAGHSSLTRIPVGAIGVRQHNWGAGIESHDHPPGIYFGLRGHVSWHVLDAGTQILHFVAKPEGPADFGPLEIRTKDNNSIRVEATVAYRVEPGAAHEIVRRGWEFSYQHHARNIVENQLRKRLADLGSEDWFDTDVRLGKLAELAPELKAAFARFHLECIDVSIHGVEYPPKFQEKLQETQIQYQKAKLLSAKRAVAEEEAKVGIFEERTKALVNVRRLELQRDVQRERMAHLARMEEIESRTAAYDREVRAEADAAHAALVAEGEQAVERSKAEAERERLGVLASPGGRLLFARDAARELTIESVTLGSADPVASELLDPDALVRRLVGPDAGAR